MQKFPVGKPSYLNLTFESKHAFGGGDEPCVTLSENMCFCVPNYNNIIVLMYYIKEW